MSGLPDCHRWATPGDAGAMAELVNMAGEGLPYHVWRQSAERGETPWDVGRQRAQRDAGAFSFRNTVVREHGGQVVAALIGYPLPDKPDPIDYDAMPAMFLPLQELENEACGTWYVNVLATYPAHRGQGYGGQLLVLAEQLAADTLRGGLSLIVSDANAGARRLYARTGYREAATRPMVKNGWDNNGKNWVLLVKSL